jgi:hypothetical protein
MACDFRISLLFARCRRPLRYDQISEQCGLIFRAIAKLVSLRAPPPRECIRVPARSSITELLVSSATVRTLLIYADEVQRTFRSSVYS